MALIFKSKSPFRFLHTEEADQTDFHRFLFLYYLNTEGADETDKSGFLLA